MNSLQIHKLLDKYWNCETSVKEEEKLRDFFTGVDVPEEFRQYIPLFTHISDEKSVTLSEDFNKKWLNTLKKEEKKQYITIRIFAPLLRMAVSILLIIGLGVSFYFISRQDNRPRFVETFEDPNAAMQQAAFALEKLSHAIQKSEMASMKTILFISDKLEIDWTAIDTLNRIGPLELDSVANRNINEL